MSQFVGQSNLIQQQQVVASTSTGMPLLPMPNPQQQPLLDPSSLYYAQQQQQQPQHRHQTPLGMVGKVGGGVPHHHDNAAVHIDQEHLVERLEEISTGGAGGGNSNSGPANANAQAKDDDGATTGEDPERYVLLINYLCFSFGRRSNEKSIRQKVIIF